MGIEHGDGAVHRLAILPLAAHRMRANLLQPDPPSLLLSALSHVPHADDHPPLLPARPSNGVCLHPLRRSHLKRPR